MVHVILSHQVKDAAEWRAHFDSDEANRAAAGIKVHGVYTSAADPNQVTVMTEFPNTDVLNAFMNNPDLKAAMERGGVISEPEVKVLIKM
ncbi:MAG: DUF3764 family protein [Bacteroidota bacterium]